MKKQSSKPYLLAYCWASGQIEFGTKVPEGALQIAHGPESKVRKAVTVVSRLAYDHKTLLVPGIPEATDENAKLEALTAFCIEVKKRTGKR